ncbi:MAG: ferric reductase-like transmembrane domain-containing protein [Chloroflexi bacterium]|nr:ferric reductase-like transmembrane domain-containing protein [Chloroflexota bacterium]
MLDAGKWAIRFLLVSLAITPVYRMLGWRSAIPLRKSAGLWAFGFGALHFTMYLTERNVFNCVGCPEWWRPFLSTNYLLTGAIVLAILSVMALTSNRLAMRTLGKNWKRLHRLVYAAGIIAVVHGVLAAQFSKKVLVLDPNAQFELIVYGVILAVLLLLRVPAVRNAIGLTGRTGGSKRRGLAQAGD